MNLRRANVFVFICYLTFSSVQPQCSLCLRGRTEFHSHHRDTKNTEGAQSKARKDAAVLKLPLHLNFDAERQASLAKFCSDTPQDLCNHHRLCPLPHLLGHVDSVHTDAPTHQASHHYHYQARERRFSIRASLRLVAANR